MTIERAIEVLKHTTGNINWDANREEIYFTDEWVQAYEMAIAALKGQDVTDKNVGNKWISVKDRLPKINDTEPWDEFVKDKGYQFLVTDEEGYIWVELFLLKANKFDDPSVTHWMPLPEPPKGEEG